MTLTGKQKILRLGKCQTPRIGGYAFELAKWGRLSSAKPKDRRVCLRVGKMGEASGGMGGEVKNRGKLE